ncbi:MAG: hypothetical protein H6Q61_714 [Firmicutes bacterium]|nr:hypothetical protein [Bacillota bacterium]
MTIRYRPKGVCSRDMTIEVEKGMIQSIHIDGGCSGNLQGLARLAEERPVAEVIPLLAGIRCGLKKTSCPDQLAKALQSAL